MRKLYEDVKASYGVKASVASPTGIRARPLPGSKTQGDKTYPMQGSSVKPDYEDDETPGQKEAKSPGAGADKSPPPQGSSKISQPPQVTSEDLDLSEDFEAIFEGTDLTEDFKAKAYNVFEAAVISRINEKLDEHVEALNEEFEAAKEALGEEMSEQLDQYLDYVIEQWMEDNALAVDSGIKNELAESFLAGFKALMEEHYVDLPEDKGDVLTDLANRVAELEAALNDQIDENVELNSRLGDFERELAFAEVAEGLADTQVAKLETLAESVSYTDPDEFKNKLVELRESYFPKAGKVAKTSSFDDEEPIDLQEESTIADPNMRAYADVISRSVKK